jgi:hypothetical protein
MYRIDPSPVKKINGVISLVEAVRRPYNLLFFSIDQQQGKSDFRTAGARRVVPVIQDTAGQNQISV